MKNLRFFIHEFLIQNPDMNDTLGKLKNMESAQEMLGYIESVYIPLMDELKSSREDTPDSDKVRLLSTVQFFRKLLKRTAHLGTEPTELHGFIDVSNKPNDVKVLRINKIINAYNRQL